MDYATDATTNDWYDMRKKTMEHQRWVEKLSLKQIGDYWRISRERVRQILGSCGKNNGGFNWSRTIHTLRNPKWMEAHKGLSNREMADLVGLDNERIHRPDYFHPVSGDSVLAKSTQWTVWASEYLENLGYPNQLMPLKCPYEILLENSYRIAVRVAYKTTATSEGIMSPQYHFRLNYRGNRKQRPHVDFYLFIVAESQDCFVVPSWKIKADSWEVFFCWPTRRPEIGKYQQYYNRFELLGRGV